MREEEALDAMGAVCDVLDEPSVGREEREERVVSVATEGTEETQFLSPSLV